VQITACTPPLCLWLAEHYDDYCQQNAVGYTSALMSSGGFRKTTNTSSRIPILEQNRPIEFLACNRNPAFIGTLAYFILVFYFNLSHFNLVENEFWFF